LSRDNPFDDSRPQLGRTGGEVLVELEQVVSGRKKRWFSGWGRADFVDRAAGRSCSRPRE